MTEKATKTSTAKLKSALHAPVQKARLNQLKQGVIGFANGVDMTVMADTGSRENMIKASYAQELGLTVLS